MNQNIEGTYAAVITPFGNDTKPVLDELVGHLHHLKKKGCDGVLVCGTTGEGTSMSVPERKMVLKAAVEANTGLHIFAGTGAASIEDAIDLTQSAFDSGVSGVVVLPPFFFRELQFEGICDFYSILLTRAVPTEGSLLLYHNPIATNTFVSLDLLKWLSDRFPQQVVGIKDSSNDLSHTRQLCSEFPHLSVFVGDDRLLAPARLSGAAGAITGLANIFADLLKDAWQAVRETADTENAQQRLSAAHAMLDGLPRIAAIKTLLYLGRVIKNPQVRAPLRGLTEQEQVTLRERFNLTLPLPKTLDVNVEYLS